MKEHLSITDLNTNVTDLDSQTIPTLKPGSPPGSRDPNHVQPLTVREAIRRSLTSPYQDEEPQMGPPAPGAAPHVPISPEVKIERYNLASRVRKAGEEGVSLDDEDRTMIKALTIKYWSGSPEILGFLNDFLDLKIKK